MGSAKKSSNTARQARIAEMRRAEEARGRRNRILMIALSTVVVVGLVAGGVVLVRSQSDDSSDEAAAEGKASGKFVTGEDGVRTWDGDLGRNHVTKKVSYPVEPPVGGDHNQVWMNCNGDVYTKPLENEHAVHSLEHGAVWVTYTDKAPKADVEKLAAKVKQTPYSLMSPDDGQKDPIVLTAWGHQRTVTGADDPDVNAFFENFVQGEQTPEPGAACTNGLSQ
ncbi:DUF3105 domain-containing protein [Streptomyces olivaceus]|uniref:DUF3105 domain-containing protein n=1 Tax=Streptomyces olivaceus TaxID=47716 RepID=A0ABS7W9I3_STROV|nr:DUF3105 domain-containing protein [Streptomyces olivaceus]MBZ6089200.1 DUF3105 domain-containing protein [Streptomyces olivaceus]MBZ6097338.1 DUF3105 domain-containing protein [Streptomyces olivaceus]MBZ6120690.1 DUF3105 domain-containing protein [Streptomyces olivaceus]MBZ6154612.1 DUF3105 domain-containing protein [Streptomyces olivaceus]MBZ6302048.1 DUF3105 domain-containing protein [Streptomyces olivaceus]